MIPEMILQQKHQKDKDETKGRVNQLHYLREGNKEEKTEGKRKRKRILKMKSKKKKKNLKKKRKKKLLMRRK